jgi:hypothetical protein
VTGMNKHLEHQAMLAGMKAEGGSGEQSAGGTHDRMMVHSGDTPDDIPDISTMFPIETVN